jgi:hypothetical protein
MNERIKLLAEQASEIDGDDLLYYHPVFAEKFAELIVRQCALTAGLMEHDGRKNIGAQILDNFGIQDDTV